MSGKYSNTRIYTSGICRYNDKYLILRISKFYKICPGDWEWLTCSLKLSNIINPNRNIDVLRKNVLSTANQQAGLEGNILKSYPPHTWYDSEYDLFFVLYPILIQIEDPYVMLSQKKFTEYKWIGAENILNFDRNNYLADFMNHLNKFGGM